MMLCLAGRPAADTCTTCKQRVPFDNRKELR